MTEEFALDEAHADRAAVHLHKRTPVTRAAVVDGASDEFLACACLAFNEHRRFRRRDLVHLLKHGEQRAAVTHYLGEVVLTTDFLLQINVLCFEPCLFLFHQHAIGDVEEHCARVGAAGIGS